MLCNIAVGFEEVENAWQLGTYIIYFKPDQTLKRIQKHLYT